MAWEKFRNTGRSLKPKVSIRANTQIGFNNAAITEFKLASYKYAVLFFDSETRKIGIRPMNNKDEEGACKLNVRPEGGASIPAKAYIEYYKLINLKIRKFDADWDDKEKMIIARVL